MTVADFETASANRVAAGAKAFVNSRGAVAGSIRSVDRTYETPMTFAAYELTGDFDDHLSRMAFAAGLGFPAACDLIPAVAGERVTAEQVVAAIEAIGAERAGLVFPIDGAVIKANRESTRRRLGLASRTPYWATAFKYPPDTASTVLRDIEVRVGRTGRITLRAIIDPVHVAGPTLTRATQHKPQWVLDPGLAGGPTVAMAFHGAPQLVGPAVPHAVLCCGQPCRLCGGPRLPRHRRSRRGDRRRSGGGGPGHGSGRPLRRHGGAIRHPAHR